MQPELGIVLLNWNNWQETLACLEQLRRLDYPNGNFRMYVVDNASQDDSLTQLRAQADITLIELSENRGFAGGNNPGIQRALDDGCRFILLLNNDTLIPSSLLAPLLQVFSEHPSAGVVSPKIYYADPANTIWYAGGRFRQPRILGELIGMGEIDRGQYDTASPVDFAVGGCMLVRREVFDQIGLLDERLFFYHEDVDFSFRAAKAGFQSWYQPAVSIVHKVSHSTRADLPSRTYLYAQARTVFLIKHIHGLKIPLVIAMEVIRLLRNVLGSLAKGEKGQAVAYTKGAWHGLRAGYRFFYAQPKPARAQAVEEIAGANNRLPSWKRLLSLAIALAVFSFLGVRAYQGLRQIIQTGLQFTPGYLLASLACQVMGVILAGGIWSDILRRLGAQAGFWTDLQILCVTALARKLPGPVWYAIGRLALYHDLGKPRGRVIIALVVESVVLALGGLVTLGFSLSEGLLPLAGLSRNVLRFGIIPLLLVFAAWLGPRAIRFAARRTRAAQINGISQEQAPVSTWDCMRWLTGQALVVALAGGVAFFLLKSIDATRAIPYHAVLGALSLAVVLGPLAVWLPGDIGLRDGFMYLALSPLSDGAFAGLITLAWRIWVSILELIAGGVAALALQKRLTLLRPGWWKLRRDVRND